VIALLPLKLADEMVERVRRNFFDAIAELQRGLFARAKVIKDVTLADGVTTPIAHGLGRPVLVLPTPPRGATAAGYILEVRDGNHDRTKVVILQANDFGAAITVDLVVVPL